MQPKPTRTSLIKEEAQSGRAMVATKHVVATRAGLETLRAGGNAVDAAVAACLTAGVVEPYSSGIGGGGYLVYQVGDRGGVVGFPMRGPMAARPDMYSLTGESSVGTFGWPGVVGNENLEGYRSIAVPGAVRGLCEAHQRLGQLPLRDVVEPAVRAARGGFTPGWFNLYTMGLAAGKLFRHPELSRVFMPGGEMPTGDLSNPPVLRQPDLADVLETIGREGPEAYYKGDVGKAITSDIQGNGGMLSREDLAAYRPFIWEGGLEFAYRGHTVRVPPPHTCAGVTSAMTLKLLDGFDVQAMGHNSADMLHAYISCARLAFADRFAHMADPEFVDVPWKGLLSEEYTRRRRESIEGSSATEYEPGDPWVEEGRRAETVLAASRPAWEVGTTHLCVVDGDGNAVSLTNTIVSVFGSGVVPQGTGIVMNNAMLWFDPVPGRINSIMPGKFGLNNMTPALVLDKGGVRAAVGASGGRLITNCVTQFVVKMLDFAMGPQEAVDSPRIDCSRPFTSVDPRIKKHVRDELESRGHRIQVSGDDIIQTGFSGFASPAAILREENGALRAGVDTFHSAYAEGL